MANRVVGKTSLVMGAGSIGPGWGNGKAIAVRLAQEGAKVFAVDRNLDAANETKSLIGAEGGECTAFEADATVADQVAAAVEACKTSYETVDILVNNIGIGEAGGVVDTSEESWDRVFEVNLKTMFLACKFVVPHMRAQGGGSIVNISSLASIRWGGKKLISYAASKAGMNQMTRVMAVEHAPENIRVNVILPGLIATPMGLSAPGVTSGLTPEMSDDGDPQTSFVPMGHLGSAWDVANAALYLASDEARYVTGIELLVDGGLASTLVARAD